jgi:hypothetical protein
MQALRRAWRRKNYLKKPSKKKKYAGIDKDVTGGGGGI